MGIARSGACAANAAALIVATPGSILRMIERRNQELVHLFVAERDAAAPGVGTLHVTCQDAQARGSAAGGGGRHAFHRPPAQKTACASVNRPPARALSDRGLGPRPPNAASTARRRAPIGRETSALS
jgi:hypothetical protein